MHSAAHRIDERPLHVNADNLGRLLAATIPRILIRGTFNVTSDGIQTFADFICGRGYRGRHQRGGAVARNRLGYGRERLG